MRRHYPTATAQQNVLNYSSPTSNHFFSSAPHYANSRALSCLTPCVFNRRAIGRRDRVAAVARLERGCTQLDVTSFLRALDIIYKWNYYIQHLSLNSWLSITAATSHWRSSCAVSDLYHQSTFCFCWTPPPSFFFPLLLSLLHPSPPPPPQSLSLALSCM